MSNNLSQLDELIESDVLAALGESPADVPLQTEETITQIDDEILNDENSVDDIGDIEILPLAEIESALDEQEDEIITMSSGEMGSLAQILSKLLNNP